MKSLNHSICSFRSFLHEEKVSCHESVSFFAAHNIAVSSIQFQNEHILGGTILHIKSIKDDGKPGREEGPLQ